MVLGSQGPGRVGRRRFFCKAASTEAAFSLGWDNRCVMHDVVKYLRANPQALALLVISVVLGVGTFIAVIVALIASGSTTTTGEPDGLIIALHLLAI
jgi:hypothetical protein